jgi:hypothetical protein
MSSSSAKHRTIALLLVTFLAWRAVAASWKIAQEVRGVHPEVLRAALTYSEEERIRASLGLYDEGEALELYKLYRAVDDHGRRDATLFVVGGEDPHILRALTAMTGFFYPRRVHIARRLPEPQERRVAPELLVLTLRGPYRDSPTGFKEPIVATPAWTLWK